MIQDELDKLGKTITSDAKRLALPNKKTGKLDKSFKYNYTFVNNEKFTIVISEMDYGKYLNAKTHYMDKAIDKNVKNISPIINIMIDEMLNKIIDK